MGDGTYQLLPPLAGDDLDRLKAGIVERGVEVPVVVDEEGAIIDGHNRAMIADSLGIEYPKTVRTGLSAHEKRVLAVELNLARRQLTDGQKAMLGRKIEDDVAKVVEEKRIARMRKSRWGRKSPAANAAGQAGPSTKTTDQVAARVGIGSGSTYERHKKVLDDAEDVAPELVPYVEAGDLSMKDLKREVAARRSPAEQSRSATKPTLAPVANVPPEVRRVASLAHDVVQRVRLLRSQHEVGRLALGIEGGVFAGELEALRDELDGFARELRAAADRQGTNGGRHGRAAG